jgi:hypothetical protein
MALIIEDGSLVANANSYVTLSEVRAYADARGIILPLADVDLEPLIIKASDYIESISNFKGDKVEANQSLNWPRANVSIGLSVVNPTIIPSQIKKAQLQLTMHSNDNVDLNPITTGNFVVREKIGPIETQYSEKLNTDLAPQLPLVEALLTPLLSPFKPKYGGFGFLPVTRI